MPRRWRNRWNEGTLAPRDRSAREHSSFAFALGRLEWLPPEDLLRDDDARFFALKLGGLRKLAAKEFDEAAGAGAAVGAQEFHTVEKNPQIEDVQVLEACGVSKT